MKTIVHVPVEPMTAESFAPFGRVFGAERVGAERRMLPIEFAYQGRVTLSTIHNPDQGLAFSKLERHFAVTQAFVQLSGAPAVVCVAPPTDEAEMSSVPDPHAVRGFLIDPAHGYLFHRGTWHSLDRYVLAASGASFLIVNVDPNPTQMVDFSSGDSEWHDDLGASPPRALAPMQRRGVRFELAL